MLRGCFVVLLLIALSILMAGCSSGGGQVITCGGIGDPCPVVPGPAFLYATSGSNGGEILAFTIDRSTGTLGTPTTIPGPMSSGITAAQNQFLYVSDTVNGLVDAFSINQTTGALTDVAGSPFSFGSTPPNDLLGLVAGTDLYASSNNGISSFTIAANGALTPVIGSPFSGGLGGQAAIGQSNTTPINYFLYATNLEDKQGSISAFTVNSETGVLTSIPGTFTTGRHAGPDGIVFDQSPTLGPFVFVALNTLNEIAGFSVDPTTGALTAVPGSPFNSGTSPVFLALSENQNFLYATNFSDGSISGYSIASDGGLTPVPGSPFVLGDTPGNMITTATNFLYVTLPGSGTILGFSIGANGTLTTVEGSPFSASGALYLATVQIPPS